MKGSFQTEARFMVSWTTPWLAPPSPKNVSATRSVPWIFAASAAPGADRHARGDDAVAAEDVQVERRDVHRAAQAPAVPVLAPHQLGHHPVHPGALGDRVAVAPVVRDDEVVLAQVRAGAGGHRLLADVAVGGALHDALQEELGDLLVESPDLDHRAVDTLAELSRELHGGILSRGLGMGPWRRGLDGPGAGGGFGVPVGMLRPLYGERRVQGRAPPAWLGPAASRLREVRAGPGAGGRRVTREDSGYNA